MPTACPTFISSALSALLLSIIYVTGFLMLLWGCQECLPINTCFKVTKLFPLQHPVLSNNTSASPAMLYSALVPGERHTQENRIKPAASPPWSVSALLSETFHVQCLPGQLCLCIQESSLLLILATCKRWSGLFWLGWLKPSAGIVSKLHQNAFLATVRRKKSDLGYKYVVVSFMQEEKFLHSQMESLRFCLWICLLRRLFLSQTLKR